MKKENIKKIIIGIIVLLIVVIISWEVLKMINNKNKKEISMDKSFIVNFIRKVNNENKKKENYLVSPYSVEIALNLLREGATDNSKDEIDRVCPSRDLKINNENVKIANAAFIKNTYKDYVEKNFTDKIKNDYNSEILYDEFKEPTLINNWVSEHTDKMIPKLLDKMDEKFVLGIANAIAIDATWQDEFECSETTNRYFKKENGKKVEVEMMNNLYKRNVRYLDEKDKGIILPYNEDLEFIAILPKDGVDKYINNLDRKSLENIDSKFKEATDKNRVNINLPRFNYEYDLAEFKDILKDMGIKEVFNKEKANLSGIITKENLQKLGKENIYVEDAIHKTNINLNEKGTKAAAVTYFGINELSSAEDMSKIKIHEINFNKPFVYIIRDKETKNILFFGAVHEPNIWNGTTCEAE